MFDVIGRSLYVFKSRRGRQIPPSFTRFAFAKSSSEISVFISVSASVKGQSVIGNEPNADEVKAHRMKTLGPELGLVYNALYNKCVLLHVKWRQYLELFWH
jgi:hypothetical protein